MKILFYQKKFLEIDNSNKEVFIDIIYALENEVTENSSSKDIQTLLYEGKKHKFENLKDFQTVSLCLVRIKALD